MEPDLTYGLNEGKHSPSSPQELMFSWEKDIDIFAKGPNEHEGHSLSLPPEAVPFMQGEMFTSGHDSTSFEYASDPISGKGEPPLLSLSQEVPSTEERMFAWETDLVWGDPLPFGSHEQAY
jgi:hypothetical protein